MSLHEADSKFPWTQHRGEPPSPSIENPGAVYPWSDPDAASKGTVPGTGDRGRSPMSLLAVGNPFLLQDVLYKVDRALTDAIEAIEGDGGRVPSTGPDGQETLLAKLERWREELDDVRTQSGGSQSSRANSRESETTSTYQREGGLFAD